MEVGDSSVVDDVLQFLEENQSEDERDRFYDSTTDDEFVGNGVENVDDVSLPPFPPLLELPDFNEQYGAGPPDRPLLPLEVNLEVVGRNIQLEDHWTTFNERFGIDGVVYRFVPDLREYVEDVVASFAIVINKIFDHLRLNFDGNDFVEIFINGDGFKSGGFSLPLTKIESLDPRSLLNQFADIVQSNEDIEIDDGSFTIEVYHVSLPRGAGYSARYLMKSYGQSMENILKNTRSLLNVPKTAHPYCAAAALIVGEKFEQNGNFRNRDFSARFVNRLVCESKALCRQAGLSVGECRVDLEGVKKLSKLSRFAHRPIHVISRECHNSVVLSVNKDEYEKPFYLYLSDNHFYFIKSVNALLGGEGRFCPVCNLFFTGKTNRHICDAKVCSQCKTVCGSSKIVDKFIKCDSCLRLFYSEICFNNHLIVGNSPLFSTKFCVCEKLHGCKTCGVELVVINGEPRKEAYTKRPHECFKSRCLPIDPLEPKFKDRIDKKRGQFCFFDIETQKVYDEELKRTVFKPNLIVFQFEDGTEKVFVGDDCLQQFSEFLFVGNESLVARNEYFNIVGHNTARFDSFFLLQSFLENLTDDPKIFFDGRSPLKITLGRKVTIIDSFKFLQAPLAKLPSMFDLPVKKGFFPHDFNLPENKNYVGRIPSPSYFGTKFMTKDKFKEFEEWYLDWGRKYIAGEIPDWNFQDELLAHCSDDVTVLRLAWLALWKAMYELTNLHIGIENVTAASFTNLVWRSTIPPFKISLIPKNNYTSQNQQSKEALVWLKYNDLFYYGGELEYAGKNYGEKVLYLGREKFRVDGFHKDSNTVLEFLGCVFHGCSKCFKNELFSIFGGRTMRYLRMQVDTRKAKLIEQGFNVVFIWECEWKEMMQFDQEIISHLQEIKDELMFCKDPIEPRQALYGGRTETTHVYSKADLSKKESIRGVDFTSLYPAVMKQENFPVGHPIVFRGSPGCFDYTPQRYFGLMHCKMIPPRQLFHPVLPNRFETDTGNKLIFSLCRMCSENLYFSDVCTHTAEERSFVGVWCTPEIYKAQNMGYILEEIYEVWDYPSKSKNLLKAFVDKFLKIKQENSGFPSGCDTREKKEKYVEEYETNEGVKLDIDKIRKNKPYRLVAKILLNSCWGFWARKRDKKKTNLTHKSDEFFKWVTDDTLSDKSFRLLNKDTVLVSGKPEKDFLYPDKKGNVMHAAFVTCYARLKLYNELLDTLKDRVLYMDTDSAIYFSKEGDFHPPLGDYLGDLTNILDDDESIIETFCSGGPKNYGYTVVDERDGSFKKTEFKVRGITLNRTTERKVNFEMLQNLIFESALSSPEERTNSGFSTKSVLVPKFDIRRGTTDHPFFLEPREIEKTYRLVFDKRVICWDDYKSYPFGYK